MPSFAAVGLPRSVRTCFACNRRRFPPAFVAWNYDNGAVCALCEGCLDRPDREEWARRFLRESEAEFPHWFFYIAGIGTSAVEVFSPLLAEAFEEGKMITRNLRGLADGNKAFWRCLRGGPAPSSWIEYDLRGRVAWSATVWDGQEA